MHFWPICSCELCSALQYLKMCVVLSSVSTVKKSGIFESGYMYVIFFHQFCFQAAFSRWIYEVGGEKSVTTKGMLRQSVLFCFTVCLVAGKSTNNSNVTRGKSCFNLYIFEVCFHRLLPLVSCKGIASRCYKTIKVPCWGFVVTEHEFFQIFM